MEKGSPDDPMDFLKAMKLKTALILDQLEGTEENHVATARRDIESIHEGSTSQRDRNMGDGPPQGLSGEEEVEWWRRRIASLSGPVDVNAEAKSVSSRQDEKGSKSSMLMKESKIDEGDEKESK